MRDEFERHWLSDLPAAWTEKRADFLCSSCRVIVDPIWFSDDLVAHYSIPNVQETRGPLIEPASDIDSSKLLIDAPMLLVSKLNPRKKTVCLAEPHREHPTLASGEFVGVKSEKVDRRYAYYLWSSDKVTDRLSAIVQSVTRSHQRVNPADILKLPWKWPHLDTQRRIARFLDEKTARIDGLIERKRALLDRLAEKRQALITRAVTKGLSPDVPMKPSGIDWLGDIPSHWEVKRLGHVSQILLGLTYSPGDLVDENEGIFVIRASNVQNGRLVRGDNVFVNVDVSESIINRLGDIVVCSRNGSRNLIGKNAVVTEEWVGCTFGAFMTTIRTELSTWVCWVLASTLFEFQSGRFMSTTINQLTISTLKSFPIPIPPKRHADRISQELQRICSSIDTQHELVARSVEKLVEYRSALITAAVTGQLATLR